MIHIFRVINTQRNEQRKRWLHSVNDGDAGTSGNKRLKKQALSQFAHKKACFAQNTYNRSHQYTIIFFADYSFPSFSPDKIHIINIYLKWFLEIINKIFKSDQYTSYPIKRKPYTRAWNIKYIYIYSTNN